MILVPFLYLITGVVGFIVLIAILRQYQTNRIANIYFIIILLFVIVRFSYDGIMGIKNATTLSKPIIENKPFLALIFPCFFLYFKNLFRNIKSIQKKELYHFIFPVLLGMGSVITPLYYFQTYYLKFVFHLFFICLALYYVYLSYRILKREVWSKRIALDQTNKLNIRLNRWVAFLFVMVTLVAFRLVLSLFLSLIHDDFSVERNLKWIATIIWDILLVEMLLSPEILYGYDALNTKIKEKKQDEFQLTDFWVLTNIIPVTNVLDLKLKKNISENSKDFIVKIENAVLNRDCFREPNFKLDDFAKQLEIPKSHLNYIFKYHCKSTFTEFKKTIRIHDAILLIDADYLHSNTLDSLAKKVGFASYNPFLTSFKAVNGNAPQDYARHIK